ncbi:MAG: hypothetical protein EA362_08840 [Saprospirales bacterium]|nr:MAG: hypothetical protein EA362_08840 [Saprospirales bacterium]
MNIGKVIKIIKALDSNAKVFLPKEDLSRVDFQPASIKALIPYGIYYLFGEIKFSNNFYQSIIITNDYFKTKNSAIVVVFNPKLIHYKLSRYFELPKKNTIHPTAIIHKNAEIGDNVHIDAYSVIGSCRIGANSRIMNNVVIEDNVELKNDVFIDSNSVIGAAGMAWIWDEKGNRIIQPQIGGVIISENVRIATGVTIVRGSLSENTFIGANTVIAHGSKIGHGCQIHKNVHLANNVSLAGNAYIEENVFLGSASVVSSNIKVPKGSIVGAGAVVTRSFEEENITLAGVPAKIIKRENFKVKPKGVPRPFQN